ncbi:phage tail termination protein [Bordetella trematum]|uniref:phage tail termination protein n=1 Tax=Bordetella trematum TaxID=123899 RepID=UPI00046F3F32|nr:hypothetical protein [Bordetella trematum]
MFDEFKAWAEAVLGSRYSYTQGQWEETTANQAAFFCSLHSLGGPSPDVDDRRPRYRVLLLGPRGQRSAAQQTKVDIHALADAALMGGLIPCGAASIRALGEPAGPGYTTENRAWWSLDFQITY